MKTTDFSAKEPSLGYYHQIRYSLYLAIEYSYVDNASISIESLDDIVVDSIDNINLFQTKLHLNNIANLTDRSSDFWKTVRIWSENIKSGNISEASTLFSLITTANIGNDSFLIRLKKECISEEIDKIRTIMLAICDEESNKENQKAYCAFKNLSLEQQNGMLKNIRIVDSSLSIENTLLELKRKIRLSAPVGQVDIFLENLEGWWFQQCILLLQKKRPAINIKELHRKISDIRELYTEQNLPDDFPDPVDIDESSIIDYGEKIFVKQLKLVSIKSNTLRNAISDFRRAYDQRSRWFREELTYLDEYEKFDKLLIDHWNNIFAIMKDECEELSDLELERIGRDFYKKYYIESIPPYKIREKFQSSYLTRGSCHMLADEKKIGWHPNFKMILEK